MASWGAPVPPLPPCPCPHISSCWLLDSAVHQPGTGWCFRGDEEELEGCLSCSWWGITAAGSPSNPGHPGTRPSVSQGAPTPSLRWCWKAAAASPAALGEKTGICRLGCEICAGCFCPPTTLGAEAQRGARLGQVCGSGAAGSPVLSSRSLQRPPSAASWGGTSREPAGRRSRGWGCGQQTWPPRNVRMGSSGKTATSHQLRPLGSGEGIPGGQREAEAYPCAYVPFWVCTREGSAVPPAVPSPVEGISAWLLAPLPTNPAVILGSRAWGHPGMGPQNT